MSDYFKYFPRVNYNITGTVTDNRTAIDIMTNFELPEEVRGQVVSYFPFVLGEFDRPEDVSYSYYGSTKYTFLVWKMNNIVDPYFDWYQPAPVFNDYIAEKYGSQQTADTLIYRYSDNEGNIIAEIDERILSRASGTAEERVNASRIDTNQVSYIHPGEISTVETTVETIIDLGVVFYDSPFIQQAAGNPNTDFRTLGLSIGDIITITDDGTDIRTYSIDFNNNVDQVIQQNGLRVTPTGTTTNSPFGTQPSGFPGTSLNSIITNVDVTTIVPGTAITLTEAINLGLVTQTTATNFEFSLNEEKRTIRVIDNDVIDLVFTEFVKILRS